VLLCCCAVAGIVVYNSWLKQVPLRPVMLWGLKAAVAAAAATLVQALWCTTAG
jgi:hypothetical protein